MCTITSFRVVRVPSSAGYDCPVASGIASPQSNGQMRSLIDNCYRRVSRW